MGHYLGGIFPYRINSFCTSQSLSPLHHTIIYNKEKQKIKFIFIWIQVCISKKKNPLRSIIPFIHYSRLHLFHYRKSQKPFLQLAVV